MSKKEKQTKLNDAYFNFIIDYILSGHPVFVRENDGVLIFLPLEPIGEPTDNLLFDIFNSKSTDCHMVIDSERED